MPKFDPYADSVIKKDDTLSCALTLQQAASLTRWAEHQHGSLFDDDHVTIQQVLDVFHASIEWISFEAWLEEEPGPAIKAYNAAMPPSKKLEAANA